MSLHNELYFLIAAVLYPLWLAAAGVDYLCHRRTAIERTSGWRESAMHVLQYMCIAPTVVLAALFTMSGFVLWFASAAMLLHTAIAYVDVSYTNRRRFISALEQHVHGVMTIVPLVAIALLALTDAEVAGSRATLRGEAGLSTLQFALIFVTTALLGGIPVLEELRRTMRMRSAHPSGITPEPSAVPSRQDH